MLDRQVCERARIARDARFDGQFVTGVLTTRVYCRPICPVRPARSENVRFFPSAVVAEGAGFRPCLRCRPELAPDADAQPAMALVVRGLKLINRGFLDEHSVRELASELAVGERQLTRLFQQQLGTTPGATARTRRVQFAKRLLDETGMPITELAFAAGFSSIRGFNAAFARTYGRPPAQMRRGPRHTSTHTSISVRLAFRPPFDWTSLMAILRAEATPGVEAVDSAAYRRTICVNGQPGWFEVSPIPGANYLRLRLQLSDSARLASIVERVGGIFDLTANPQQIGCQLVGHPQAAQLLSRSPGLRIPGTWDGFEVAIRTLVAEDVGPARITAVLERLVMRHGQCLESSPSSRPGCLFPTPSVLAKAQVAECGLSPRAGARINSLAQSIVDGVISFEPTVSFDDLVADLERTGGFDRPAAHWIAMRTLREPDALPFGAQAVCGLNEWDGTVLAAHDDCRPWRSYMAVSLVVDRLRRTVSA